jgi:non-specific serine/threonine protein kinase/serine/threonine-protein kinase
MTPERWQRVKDVLHEALPLAASDRDRLLDRIRVKDPDVATEAASLLAAHAQAERFIETPAPAGAGGEAILDELVPDGSQVGRRVGPYEIEREIGHGGMGTVYLASRADAAYDQRVAIKIVRGHIGDRALLDRFRRERQILADLDHPCIARLLDGGALEDGSPYFVMEYVEGAPIDRYCRERGLSVEARIDLFCRVCSAVHDAHQHLVVHRDLKPGNILVTADGVPKLLDFGIAKLIGDAAAPDLTATRLMTLESASPEQVRGEVVTTATDVYALGVMLYGLLTGESPYALPARTPHDLSRAICEVDPVRPGAVVGRTLGRAAATHARWRDLDSIVLKALRKEPARRYAGADQLADDLHRHLAGLPVRAVPDAAGYRLRKFVGRHRAAVVAGAAIVLVLVGGIVATSWQARVAGRERARAARRFDDLHKLARTVIFDMHDAIVGLPGSTKARQILVTGALEYLDGLAREAGGDTTLQRELAGAYDRVADVQGRPNTPNLGDLHGALATYRKAQAIRGRIDGAVAAEPAFRREISDTAQKVSEVLLFTGDAPGAAEEAGRAVAIEEVLLAVDGSEAQRLRVAASHDKLGLSLGLAGRIADSLVHLRRAAAILEPLSTPDRPATRDELATVYGHLGGALGSAEPGRNVVPDLAAALGMYKKEYAINEDLLAAEPGSVLARRNVMVSGVHVGEATAQIGEPGKAVDYYRRANELAGILAREDPDDVQSQSDAAAIAQRLGEALVAGGDPRAGLEMLQRSLAVFEGVAGRDPASLMTRARIALTRMGIARAHVAFGRDSHLATPVRRQHFQQGRAEFQKALVFWTEERDKGTIAGEDAGRAGQLTIEIAALDRDMAAVGGSR